MNTVVKGLTSQYLALGFNSIESMAVKYCGGIADDAHCGTSPPGCGGESAWVCNVRKRFTALGGSPADLRYLDCPADCNRNCEVFGNEVTVVVGQVSGNYGLAVCRSADADNDLEVFGNEVTLGVLSVSYGCDEADAQSNFRCGVNSHSFSQVAEFEVWPVAAKRGDAISFPIVVKKAGGVLGSANLDIDYPSTVITEPLCVIDPRVIGGQELITTTVADHKRRLSFVDASHFPAPVVTDGVIATCTAQVLSNAPIGIYPFASSRNAVGDQYGARPSSLITISGGIQVLSDTAPTPTPGPGCEVGRPMGSTWDALSRSLLMIGLVPLVIRMVSRRERGGCRPFTIVVLVCLATAAQAGQAEAPLGIAGSSGHWRLANAGRTSEAVMTAPQVGDEQRKWFVTEVKQDGRQVSGRLAMVGASFMSIGRFDVTVSPGGHFAGTVVDEDAKQVATVEGRVTRHGIKGAFTAVNDEIGDFSWAAPLPDAWNSIHRQVGGSVEGGD